jgi:hypothetical protein
MLIAAVQHSGQLSAWQMPGQIAVLQPASREAVPEWVEPAIYWFSICWRPPALRFEDRASAALVARLDPSAVPEAE